MSKAVLISIRPEWCVLIARGKKTIEVRKTAPKIKTPFKCYIYETRGFERVGNDNLNCVIGGNRRGTVIGEFVCDQIEEIAVARRGGDGPLTARGGNEVWNGGMVEHMSCLSTEDVCRYVGGVGGVGYGWHISDLKIYDQPRKLREFRKPLDCHRGNDRENCTGCWDCEIKRPPQSWCYVEELT